MSPARAARRAPGGTPIGSRCPDRSSGTTGNPAPAQRTHSKGIKMTNKNLHRTKARKRSMRMPYLDSIAENVLAERPVAYFITDEILANILHKETRMKKE